MLMTTKDQAYCSVSLPSRPNAAAPLAKKLLTELQANGYSPDDIFAVHLAFEEAFTNAVKHGNQFDPKKNVIIDYMIDSEKVDIKITDQGIGFSPGEVQDPRDDENIHKTFGRGVFLIRSYMDTVEFNQQGNSLHMIKLKGSNPAAKD